jgi:Ca2+-binding RTX toxin-like protein
MASVSYFFRTVASTFQINNIFSIANQVAPSVAALRGGGWFATWNLQSAYAVGGAIHENDGSERIEFDEPVSQDDVGDQFNSDVAGLSNGDAVVVWTDASAGANGLDILGRTFAPDGTPLTAPFLISQAPLAGSQIKPNVTALQDGGFAAVWLDEDNNDPGNTDVEIGFFDADGTKRIIQDVRDGAPATFDPHVAQLNSGAVVVVWSELVGANTRILFQRYNASGVAIGGPGLVDGQGPVNAEPDIVALAGGGFAIAYTDTLAANSESDIALKVFDKDGAFVSATVANQGATAGEQYEPAISKLSNGFLVVAWTNKSESGNENETTVDRALFDASGGFLHNPAGPILSLAYQPALAGLAGGNGKFALVYTDRFLDDADDYDIKAIVQEPVRSITGGAVDETLLGDSLPDMIYGLDGDDDLLGSSGDDQLYGGDGGDELNGGPGADKMTGGLGNDVYHVENADDSVLESPGSSTGYDTIRTKLAVQVLADNVERLYNDALTAYTAAGNASNNKIYGNNGDDRFRDYNLGTDAFSGGNGVDSMYYSGTTAAILNFATNVHGGSAAGDAFASVEKFFGSSAGNDQMTAGAARATFNGQGGNDTLTGGANHDKLYGEAGPDTLSGGGGNDQLYGGLGTDTMTGGALRDDFFYTETVASGGWGGDTITDWQDGVDFLRFALPVADAFADFTIAGNGTTTVTLALIAAPANTITLNGAGPITLSAADFLFF